MGSTTGYEKYLRLADGAVGLSGKRVLEVGGSSPPDIVAKFNPQVWTSVNLNRQDVSTFNETVEKFNMEGYIAHHQDVAKFHEVGSYDLVYSINSFEHIQQLKEGLERMYESLRPGGLLFTIFGPIWSADVGHHLSIDSDVGELHFSNGILEPWEHLTSTPELLREKLMHRYSRDTAIRAVDFIYNYQDLNRFFEHEYLEMINDSRFTKALILRKRHGKPPNVPGASSTREFMLMLKKGEVRWIERLAYLSGFTLAYLRSR